MNLQRSATSGSGSLDIDDKVSESKVMTQPPQSPPTKKQLPVLSLSPSASTTNHSKRLKSGQCREDWTLPKKHPSISEAVEVLTLTQLVEEHFRHFPLSVVLVKGLESRVQPKSIINMHFLKLTKVISTSDKINDHYLVPYNSNLKFGLIYCPGVKTENYLFERVSDIAQAQDLPKVVTCTKKTRTKNETIGAGEVLIVMEILGPKLVSKKTKVKFFSFTEKKEKVLSGDVVGRFTTDPKLAAFHLPDIVKYVPSPFPVSARLFLDEETAKKGSPLPDILRTDPVLLLDSAVETSVVATCDLLEENDSPSAAAAGAGTTAKKSSTVVEIPISQDILVSFQSQGSQEKSGSLEPLQAKALALWKDLLSPATEGQRVSLPRLSYAKENPTQHNLFTMVQEGHERESQAIKAPPQLQKDLSADLGSDKCTYQALASDAQADNQYMPLLSPHVNIDYEDPDSVEGNEMEADLLASPFTKKAPTAASTPPAQKQDYEKEQQGTQRLVRRIEALEFRLTGAASHDNVRHLSRRVEALELRFTTGSCPRTSQAPALVGKREGALQREVEALREACSSLEEEVREVRQEMREMAEKMRALPAEILNGAAMNRQKPQAPQENIAELKVMVMEDIGKLLEALGLHQHKGRFLEEQVTGEILAECDEDVLEQDLDIRDRTHRSKLMSVIRGESSPLALVADYSYVRFKTTAT